MLRTKGRIVVERDERTEMGTEEVGPDFYCGVQQRAFSKAVWTDV